MAVYYKWIKGCATNATLTEGAWTYLTWGGTVGTATTSLPKLEITTGRDGVKTDLGYVLTNAATGVEITPDWSFKGKISVNTIDKYNSTELTITPSLKCSNSISATTLTTSSDITGGSLTSNGKTIVKGTQGATSSDGSLQVHGGGLFKKNIYAIESIHTDSSCDALYFNATSDKRAKENIKPAEYSALELISKLPVYIYNYKNSSDVVTGILAQDLLQAQPEYLDLVSNTEATGIGNDYMSIKNDKLLFVLLKAIQEQQEEIQKLKQEIEKLN